MVTQPSQPLLLGSYEPLLELATGGMATVYAARLVGAGGFERLVVIKRVHQHLLSSAEFRDMFRDEARVAALIHHPNVVPVIDVVEWQGELLLVMEYVDSTALATLLKVVRRAKELVPPRIVAKIVADTLQGLHAAHEAVDMRGQRLELVHRDVSPQNILVAVDGSSRLIDFGVAKARHRITETRSGSLKGKYAYMSPEQTQAQALDRRADIFSAGAVLFEALTGDALFRGQTEFETMQRILELPIPNPSSCAPGVPAELDAVVLKSLARRRDDRYATAAQMLEALEKAVRPASSREVAAYLQTWCGERLARRRSALQAIMEGRVAPLPPTRSSGSRSPTDGRPLDTTPASVSSLGTAGQIASTADATFKARTSSRTAILAAIVSCAAAAGLFVAIWLFGRPATHAASAPRTQASVPAATTPAPQLAPSDQPSANESVSPPASSSAPPAASPPGVVPTRPPHLPATTRELQANPYGEP